MKVLDHGYVNLVDSWGSDEQIIEAARMSTGKGFQGWGPTTEDSPCDSCHGSRKMFAGGFDSVMVECIRCGGDGLLRKSGDEKLLRFLYENKHMTPFEMGGLTLEVQAPIFVFREWHRHRTQSYNEMSARYAPLPDVNYIPTIERLMIGAGGSNKQAGTVAGSAALDKLGAEMFIGQLEDTYVQAEQTYKYALAAGVPKELARLCLPVGRYSRMRASANLRNWLGFLTLRQAPNAQYEIREYANAVSDLVREKFPRTHALYSEGRS